MEGKYAFPMYPTVISNSIEEQKRNICILHVSSLVPVIFMTSNLVDNFGGLNIALEFLKVGAVKSTISCMLLPLFQMLLRNKRQLYAFHMYPTQGQSLA